MMTIRTLDLILHFLVHTKYRCGDCAAFVPVSVKKDCEPAIVAYVKASELCGNTFAHANALTGPQS